MKSYLLKPFYLLLIGLFLHTGSSNAGIIADKCNDINSDSKPEQSISNENSINNGNNVKVKKLTFREKLKLFKKVRKEFRKNKKAGIKKVPIEVLYVLAVLLPPVAVGIQTDWGEPTLWNILFWLLFWIPGIIHAFYILLR